MTVRHGFRISLTPLILWLCLGSLVILPVVNENNLWISGISEFDIENSNILDPTETDDDFLVFSMTGIVGVIPVFSQPQTTKLNFQSACLAPDSPPPKYS